MDRTTWILVLFAAATLTLGAARGIRSAQDRAEGPPRPEETAAFERQRASAAALRSAARAAAEGASEAPAPEPVRAAAPAPAEADPLAAARDLMLAMGALAKAPHELAHAHVEGEGAEAEPGEDMELFLQDRLFAAMEGDRAVLEFALERFKEEAGSRLGELLGAALGRMDDPAVDAAAVELARYGEGFDARRAGVNLLDRLDSTRPETLDAVLAIASGETDPRLQGGALYALGRATDDPAQVRAVVAAASPLAAHGDPELRRRAVIAVAEWASSPAEAAPALEGLHDGDEQVRAGAAFALGRTRERWAPAMAALAERVADPEEAPSVRELAARSLRRYPLDARAEAALALYEAELPPSDGSAP